MPSVLQPLAYLPGNGVLFFISGLTTIYTIVCLQIEPFDSLLVSMAPRDYASLAKVRTAQHAPREAISFEELRSAKAVVIAAASECASCTRAR